VVASLWEPILDVTLVLISAFIVGVAVVTFIAWRFGRRKWRLFRSHGAVVGAVALWEMAGAHRARRLAPVDLDEAYGWTPRQTRHQLWRSIDQAEAAVRTAADAGAPTASLPTLCSRLREIAVGLDQILRIQSAAAVPRQVTDQVIEVIRAATDIHEAAVASASDANGQRVRDLVRDADHELQCLSAGLSSAQSALPHRP
jgi:hypothetical protein